MLQVDPNTRPNVEDIHAELVALAFDRNLDLKSAFVVSFPGNLLVYLYVYHLRRRTFCFGNTIISIDHISPPQGLGSLNYCRQYTLKWT